MDSVSVIFLSAILVCLVQQAVTQIFSINLLDVPEDLYFLNTMPQQLSCGASGTPKPSIAWITEKNSIVQPKDGLLTITNDGSLKFNSFKLNQYEKEIHDATYRCKISNSVGNIISRQIKVKAVMDRHYSPIVYHQSSPVGGTAIFRCNIPLDMKSYIRVYSWMAIYPGGAKKRYILRGTTVDNFHALSTGELVVSDVTESYRKYKFACQSQNIYSNLTFTSSPARLYPNQPTNFPPESIVDPKDQYVWEGETITLECQASSYPFPKYTWFKDNVDITKDKRVKSTTGGSIKIFRASKSDQGLYACIITYRNKTIISKANVTIKVPLKITKAPHLLTVSKGNAATFYCESVGTRPLITEWRKDGYLLKRSNRISITTNALTILDVTTSDEGVYQCVVRSRFDEKQAAARLIVDAILPTTTISPSNSVLEAGTQVSLTCKSKGQPSPIITWWYDGKMVPESQRDSTITYTKDATGLATSVLLLKNLQAINSGKYECWASNRVGVMKASSNVNVKGKPVIADFKSEVIGASGKPLTVDCKGRGDQMIARQWLKNGIQVQPTDRIRIFENGSLNFKTFQSGDVGKYSCSIKNRYGNDRKEVNVRLLDKPSITPFRLRPMLVGFRADYLCTAQSENDFKITWYKDGEKAENIEGIKVPNLTHSKALSFNKVEKYHAGRYTCVVENEAGKATYSADFAVYEKPVFTATPVDTSVLHSHPILLPCSAKGFPQPQITWYRQVYNGKDEPINLDHRVKQMKNGTLYIGSSQASDNGKYKCRATFFDLKLVPEPLSNEVNVEVRVPAKIITRSAYEAREVKKGSVYLTCSSSGTALLSVKWFKNGIIISDINNAKYQIYKMSTQNVQPPIVNSTLQIKELIKVDNGIFECVARNNFGSDKAKFQVLVEEKPSYPTSVEQQSSTSRSINIIWKVGYDGNSPISLYKIEMKEAIKSWNAGQYFNVDGNKTFHTICNLRPGTRYSFRISATNKHGSSGESREYSFTTKEEAPSGPPLNVTLNAIARDRIEVHWKAPALLTRNGNIIKYCISYLPKDAPVSSWRNITTNHMNSVVLAHLTPYTIYTVHVQALTRMGVGPCSTGKSIRTLQGVPSAAPRSVTVHAVNSHTILVTWQSIPVEKVNGILEGYKVLYTDVDSNVPFEKLELYGLQTQLTKLKKFTMYKICVLAFTNAGDGEPSECLYKRTDEDVPGKPSEFTATPNNPSEILVSWKEPKHPNGLIKNYILYYKESDASIQHRIEIQSIVRSQMLQNLAVGKKYTVWMTAKTNKGEGRPTKPITAKTADHVTAKIMTPPGWTVTARQGHDVELPCLAIGYPKPSIAWEKPKWHPYQKKRRWLATDRPLKLFNLQKADQGLYNCTASNSYGSDWNAVKLIVQVPPLPPYNLRAYLVTRHSVNITWKPAFDGNSVILSHHVKFALKGAHGDWQTKVVSKNQNWFVLKNLTKGIAYFKVASENMIGLGEYIQPRKLVIAGNSVDIFPVPQVFAVISEDTGTNKLRRILQISLISFVVFATVVVALLLIASWDRDEKRIKKPRCRRLCCGTCCSRRKRGYDNEPYSEPELLWPWHNVKSSTTREGYDFDMTDELLGSMDDQISFRFRGGDVNVNSFERMNCNKKSRRYSSNSRILDYQPSVSYRKSKTSESSSMTYKSDGTSIRKSSNYEEPVSRKVSEPLYNRPPPMIERYLRSQEILHENLQNMEGVNEFDDNFNNYHNSRQSFISTESFDPSPSGTPEYLRRQQSRGSADGNSTVEKSPSERSSNKSSDKQIPHIELPEKASNEMLGQGSVPRALLRVASPSKRGRKRKNRKSIDSLLRTLENIEEQKILENDPNLGFNMPQTASIIRELLGSSRSYDSISSTCSSSVGELRRAFEFGKKFGLQNYDIPMYHSDGEDDDISDDSDVSTTSDFILRQLRLANFSEKPRDSNDMKVQIPLPVRLPKPNTDIKLNGERHNRERHIGLHSPTESGQGFV